MFKINKQIKSIIIIYTITIIFWLSLVAYREYHNRDIQLLRETYYKCDGWCLLHFFNYILLGFFAPKYWKQIAVIAFTYEILEIYFHKFSQFIDSKIINDTIINTTGLFVGIGLHKIYYD